ncbi:MAG: hypothetical protein AAF557_15140 [Pseudomonadota bacterium]
MRVPGLDFAMAACAEQTDVPVEQIATEADYWAAQRMAGYSIKE